MVSASSVRASTGRVACGVSAVLVAAMVVSASVRGEDWPTYRHDVRRSGVTAEELDAPALEEAWVRRSAHPPRPAWAGPARWDAYAGIRGLRSMRNYDSVFHVVVAGERLFFGSSVDDSVTCLDVRDGRAIWRYITDGPVRIAPAAAGGRVFFGSDDGHAYCLDAATGELLWKFKPSPSRPLILHNGRFIPFWPCRSGVLVDGGTAYFAMSMLPWKSSYLCAVDAATGRPEGPGRFVSVQQGQTLEGALLAAGDLLISPRGRVAPLLFRRRDGEPIGELQGGGGSFVIVAGRSRILHGPGNKTGWITGSDAGTRHKIATYKRGNAMVVAGKRAYLLTDTSLAALDRATRKRVWTRRCRYPHAMILAGGTLFLGGVGEIAAVNAAGGETLWHGKVDGRADGLAVAAGGLYASTDTGAIHCFRAGRSARRGASRKEGGAGAPEQAASPPRPAAPPLAPLAAIDDPALAGRWVFRSRLVRGDVVEDLAGDLDGRIEGTVQIDRVGDEEAIALDGAASILLAEDHTRARLPAGPISAEAWVRVDEPMEWGCIAGAFQDNGGYEKGWLLGYRKARFCFAVASRDGEKRLTYLTAPEDLENGRWYHVAGTYDGKELRLWIDGALVARSTAQRGPIAYPPRAFYEIGAYHDDDENYRMTGAIAEVRVWRRALGGEELRRHAVSRSLRPPAPPDPAELAVGPWLRFTGPDRAEVRWRTRERCPTRLEYRAGGATRRVIDASPKTGHRALLTGLPHNRVVTYVIEIAAGGSVRRTRQFECDTFFDFEPAVPAGGEAESGSACTRILERTGADRGICLVLACGRGDLALELARRSRLRVIGVDTNGSDVDAARRRALAEGLLGARVSFRRVESLAELPFTGAFADLVVTDRLLAREAAAGGGLTAIGSAREVLRVLEPGRGIAYLGGHVGGGESAEEVLAAWLGEAEGAIERDTAREPTDGSAPSPGRRPDAPGVWVRITRPELEGAGVWSHQYGRADNAAFGGESLGGARSTADLEVQWIGRPGPRAQVDRNGRKPSPLAVAGRLFTQGLHRLIGLDARNGTILWSLEVPSLGRFNMPRDSSNWCAGDEHLFVAIRDRCWKIDAATGEVAAQREVIPGPRTEWSYDWGHVALAGDRLIGSAVKEGSAYTLFWGGSGLGWYDATSGPATFKVCSENLFGLDRRSGALEWIHTGGVIINSTITIAAAGAGGDEPAGETIFLVECRNETVRRSDSRRVGLPELWQDLFLVALRARSGEKLWERPLDGVAPGTVVFYMAHGEGTLVIVSSGGKKYSVHAFDDDGGARRWSAVFPWKKSDHGAHMSRPAIAGGMLIVRPAVFDLRTGKRLPVSVPDGGCGTYAASSGALIFRAGEVTMWDPRGGKATKWRRLRPGCWLSTIPACGMLLSPEAGGGCSCGSWLETSVGFIPRKLIGR